MNSVWRWFRRLMVLCLVLVLGLGAPVAYVETMCQGDARPQPYAALIDPAHHRPETRSLMTYPEWYIVHAYEDYAEVLRDGDPHDYSYLRSIGGFWTSLCAITGEASANGEIDRGTKQMVYVIGTSFTAELALKAAYEETLGRLFAWLRGPRPTPLDKLSARQAAEYAAFLQQVPWYKWSFRADAEALRAQSTAALRDTERRLAMGLEYRAKAAYADVIAQAVAQVGQDELTLRMIVPGASPTQFERYDGVTVIKTRPEGVEIQTLRYRALTRLLMRMASDGIDVIEIAGNDDILLTAISDQPSEPGSLLSRQRQGFDDYRHLITLDVTELMQRLRQMEQTSLTLEHIHDY
ncbi:hypothetical protein J3365_19255 [Tritonibacter scottomollicae]